MACCARRRTACRSTAREAASATRSSASARWRRTHASRRWRSSSRPSRPPCTARRRWRSTSASRSRTCLRGGARGIVRRTPPPPRRTTMLRPGVAMSCEDESQHAQNTRTPRGSWSVSRSWSRRSPLSTLSTSGGLSAAHGARAPDPATVGHFFCANFGVCRRETRDAHRLHKIGHNFVWRVHAAWCVSEGVRERDTRSAHGSRAPTPTRQ
mmetsp:Transcript_24848/g.82659  ORF Transcript_24848/g.82659 Transcript_24848/m.82659 type:complete len:211 (-) Transcript_24848:413-1045(-)